MFIDTRTGGTTLGVANSCGWSRHASEVVRKGVIRTQKPTIWFITHTRAPPLTTTAASTTGLGKELQVTKERAMHCWLCASHSTHLGCLQIRAHSPHKNSRKNTSRTPWWENNCRWGRKVPCIGGSMCKRVNKYIFKRTFRSITFTRAQRPQQPREHLEWENRR